VSSLFVGRDVGHQPRRRRCGLVDFSSDEPRTLAFATVPFSHACARASSRSRQPGTDSLDLAGRVSLELADLYARAVDGVIVGGGVTRGASPPSDVHGQTVRHRPDLGFTIQLNDPARLASARASTSWRTSGGATWRPGGQGAPLVPAFHEAVFRHAQAIARCVNIGGISNVTWLAPGRPRTRLRLRPGQRAARRMGHAATSAASTTRMASGPRKARTDEVALLASAGRALPRGDAPKSTGRELFRLAWLEERLRRPYEAVDVQSTLTDFTARSIVGTIDRFCPARRRSTSRRRRAQRGAGAAHRAASPASARWRRPTAGSATGTSSRWPSHGSP
jgi:anhydro-N-acetylmuramic acid kinase